jgi:hypothetical protein
MNRFDLYQSDGHTFVVFDTLEQREVCVCSNYGEWEDAEERAKQIVKLLNEGNSNDRMKHQTQSP